MRLGWLTHLVSLTVSAKMLEKVMRELLVRETPLELAKERRSEGAGL